MPSWQEFYEPLSVGGAQPKSTRFFSRPYPTPPQCRHNFDEAHANAFGDRQRLTRACSLSIEPINAEEALLCSRETQIVDECTSSDRNVR